jgi:hypothetical protein
MRVRCKDYVISIDSAMCDGKRLVFKSSSGKRYCTREYLHENMVFRMLCCLTKDGYIVVDKLYVDEDFEE